MSSQSLPWKENILHKQALKCYEDKEYKKGYRLAEQILKKAPDHGETMALKGLFGYHLDKKDEALEFIKKGLVKDIKNPVCWHIYGLYHRSDKNYEEAMKCYSQALKYDKENLQIIRDLAVIQIHTRNYDAFADTRHRLLELRPQNRQFWIGVAIAYHTMGKPDLAIKVLVAYEETLTDLPTRPDYEHSEMLLYHNSLIEETGDIKGALEHLSTIEKHVCDQKSLKEKRAQFHLALGQPEIAEAEYRALLAHNPDNWAYFDGLRKSTGLGADQLSAEEQAKVLTLLKELQQEYPRSNTAKRLPLRYATGEAFVTVADEYLRNMLRKGVPSLFVNIKTLYSDKEKQQAIEKLVLGYLSELEKSKTFGNEGAVEPPTALLWTLYFLGQHFDFQHQTDKALSYIERAIEHTPTLVELYMTKGRILKHAGDYVQAAQALKEARRLDKQDRFINSKCTKYLLRADSMADAEKKVVKFTRADLADRLNDLVEMQAMWFSLECGESNMRRGLIGRALKRFHQVEKHFVDITEDQYDFHLYCLRKMTLRAYISLVRLEDQLRTHPYFVRAAQNAVQCYLRVFDKPEGEEPPEMEGMSDAEKKKYRNKMRKAELKESKKAEEQKAQADQEILKKGGKIDEDPEGLKYTNTTDPLGEALKFLKPLQELAAERIETHLMGFEIYIRKNKLALALRELLKSIKIEANNATLHEQLVRFALAVQKAGDAIKPAMKAVIDSHWETLYQKNGKDLTSFTDAFLNKNKDSGSVPHLISAAMAVSLIDTSNKGESKAEEIIFRIADAKFASTRSLENCLLARKTLKAFKSGRVQEFTKKAVEWYPLATALRS